MKQVGKDYGNLFIKLGQCRQVIERVYSQIERLQMVIERL